MVTKDELFTDGNKFRGHCNDVTEILETQWVKLFHPGFTASRQRIRAKLTRCSNADVELVLGQISFKTISRLPLICPKPGEAQQFCHTVSVFVSSDFCFHILIRTINSKGTDLIWNWHLNSRSFSAWKIILSLIVGKKANPLRSFGISRIFAANRSKAYLRYSQTSLQLIKQSLHRETVTHCCR